jgi:hypothetical protein
MYINILSNRFATERYNLSITSYTGTTDAPENFCGKTTGTKLIFPAA